MKSSPSALGCVLCYVSGMCAFVLSLFQYGTAVQQRRVRYDGLRRLRKFNRSRGIVFGRSDAVLGTVNEFPEHGAEVVFGIVSDSEGGTGRIVRYRIIAVRLCYAVVYQVVDDQLVRPFFKVGIVTVVDSVVKSRSFFGVGPDREDGIA